MSREFDRGPDQAAHARADAIGWQARLLAALPDRAAGADTDFKKPTPLYKIEKPPFYAAWSTPIPTSIPSPSTRHPSTMPWVTWCTERSER